MDIGVIIPELNKYGGAEKLLVECLRRWQYQHKITVYAAKINEALLKEHGVNKVKTVGLSSYFEDKQGLLLNSVLLPKIWEKEIGRHDIYHTHLWPTHLLDLHPMVWYPHEPLRVIHDLKYEQPLQDQLELGERKVNTYPKATYDLVDAKLYYATYNIISILDKTGIPDKIVANSQFSARNLSAVYHVAVSDVVYPGINTQDYFYLPPEENIVLSVNQLWPHKRVNLLIEAMKVVDKAHLYIVGTGPEREVLEAQVKALGLSDRVFFMGNVSNEELAILYARALCVVFVPIREPFGIVALEAMAAGKPLIATNEGGFTEVVTTETAFLIKPSPFEIGEKINYLLNHKAEAVKMGLAGQNIAAGYTWDRVAAELMQIFEATYQESYPQTVVAKADERLLVGIDYFVWYGKGAGAAHWNDNAEHGAVNQQPLLGYYASDSGEVIRSHLVLLQDAGVDFIAANIHIDEHGLNNFQYNVTERILDIIEEDGFNIRLCVQLCPYSADKEMNLSGIKQIVGRMVARKGYQQYGGKPVFFIFWTGIMDGNYEMIAQLRELLDDCIVISSSLRLYDKNEEEHKTFNLFDGWSLFSPLEIAGEKERYQLLDRTYREFEAGRQKIKVVTCSPGYDDTILDDPRRENNRVRCVPRENGKVFEEMLQFAQNLEPWPDIIKINTFNEFHENTHIEPTNEIDAKYMGILKHYVRLIKDRGSNREQ